MDLNMNQNTNGSGRSNSTSNGLPNLPESLDLNLPATATATDQPAAGLTLGNRGPLNLARIYEHDDVVILRNPPPRRSVSSLQGNHQSNLIHVLHDSSALTHLHRQRLAHISVSNPAHVSSSSTSSHFPANPTSALTGWQQFQGPNSLVERNFMFLGGTNPSTSTSTNSPQSIQQLRVSSAQADQPTHRYQFASLDSNPYHVNLGIGYNNTYNSQSTNNNLQSQDPPQTYSDWLQSHYNQLVNFRTDSSTGSGSGSGSMTRLFPQVPEGMARARALSMLRRSRTGTDGGDDIRPTRRNAPSVVIHEHRSTTTTRRRRGLARVILHLFNSQTELVGSVLHSNAGQAYAGGINENFATNLQELVNMMPFEEAMMGGEEMENEGLSEDEVRMSVQRLMNCRACFENEHAGEKCCICQEDYTHGEDICKLRCNHIYHFDCIREWLMRKNFCPICKAPAMNRDEAGPSRPYIAAEF